METDPVFDSFAGVPVTLSRFALCRQWVFPRERFVEYGPEDESWCRYFGFGHEAEVPGVYRFGDILVMHPDVLAALKEECVR